MSNSSDAVITWRMPLSLQNACASFNSLSGKEQEDAVTAMTFSFPKVSTAAASKKVESTPLENATATLPKSRR